MSFFFYSKAQAQAHVAVCMCKRSYIALDNFVWVCFSFLPRSSYYTWILAMYGALLAFVCNFRLGVYVGC